MKYLFIILFLSSCTSLRLVQEQQYIQAMYKQCQQDPDCGTDMDYELIDRTIYERLYSCELYHTNNLYEPLKHDITTHN